jgi:hypothetical protein
MPPLKCAALIVAAALALSACGQVTKPPQGRGKIDDPRTDNPNRVACLRQHRLPVQAVSETGLQIGPLPDGPTIQFEPSPGAAQALQIEGAAQSAEVVGAALLYPRRASDAELSEIENCLAKGVTG